MSVGSLSNTFQSADKYKREEVYLESELLELCGHETMFVGRFGYEAGLQISRGILGLKKDDWKRLWRIIGRDNVVLFNSDLVEKTGDTYYLDVKMAEYVDRFSPEEKSLLLIGGQAFEVPIYK